MNIADLILRAGGALKDGKKWQASHKIDGIQTPKRPVVSKFDLGLKDGAPWFDYEFSEDDGNHSLHGVYAFSNHGEQIRYDDKDVDSDDVILSHRFRGMDVRAVVEFQFEMDGKVHRYRFDATVAKISDVV